MIPTCECGAPLDDGEGLGGLCDWCRMSEPKVKAWNVRGEPTRDGRYILRAFHNCQQVNRPEWGWDDLADALFRACDLADGADRSSSWIITDRIDDADLVRVDITSHITYLA